MSERFKRAKEKLSNVHERMTAPLGKFVMKRFMEQSRTEARAERREFADADYEYMSNNADTLLPLDDIVTHDREILGDKASPLLVASYRNRADRLVRRVEKAEGSKDELGMRERYLNYRKDRVDIKIERINKKMLNSPDSFLSRQINRQRRQKLKALRYGQKIRTKLIDNQEQKRKTKPEELRKKIDQLVDKKIRSQQRKAQRHILEREHGIGRLNHVKRSEFLAKMTPEDKKKIVREAILLVRRDNIRKGKLAADAFIAFNDERKVTDEYRRGVE